MGDLKLFIQGGKGTYQAQVVEILGENKRIDGGIYIRYASGGSDTTTADHLTDIPDGIVKWIDARVEEPEKIDGARILAFGGYIFECECTFDDGVGYWCSIGGDEFTHWMPIPAYPK
jgi:hypothetical protein